MEKSYNKKSCRLCKSKKLNKIYSFAKNPIGDDYTKKPIKPKLYDLNLIKCSNCKCSAPPFFFLHITVCKYDVSKTNASDH